MFTTALILKHFCFYFQWFWGNKKTKTYCCRCSTVFLLLGDMCPVDCILKYNLNTSHTFLLLSSHSSSSEQLVTPFHLSFLHTKCLPLINEGISDWYTLLKSNNNFCWHPSHGKECHESQDIGCLYLMNASFTGRGVI